MLGSCGGLYVEHDNVGQRVLLKHAVHVSCLISGSCGVINEVGHPARCIIQWKVNRYCSGCAWLSRHPGGHDSDECLRLPETLSDSEPGRLAPCCSLTDLAGAGLPLLKGKPTGR